MCRGDIGQIMFTMWWCELWSGMHVCLPAVLPADLLQVAATHLYMKKSVKIATSLPRFHHQFCPDSVEHERKFSQVRFLLYLYVFFYAYILVSRYVGHEDGRLFHRRIGWPDSAKANPNSKLVELKRQTVNLNKK